jgi:ketosteroid isomerase-like protein
MNSDESTAIERACERLVLRSIRAFDERDWEGYANLFTADGVFVRANQPDEPLVGREAIAAALSERPAHRLTRHFCTNIEVEALDSTHAQGRCYLLLYSANASQPADAGGWLAETPQRIGEYQDSFVHTSKGWQIARRTGRLLMHTDSKQADSKRSS